MPTPKLPEKTRRQIFALLRAGLSQIEVAEAAGVSQGLVSNMVRLARLPGEPRGSGKLPIIDSMDPVVRSALVKAMRAKRRTVAQLAEHFNATEKAVERAVDDLDSSGYMVGRGGGLVWIESQSPEGVGQADAHPIKVGTERVIGVLSDSHVNSNWERLDVVAAAYAEFKRQRIKDVYHCGNLVDGHCNFNRYELKHHGITDQTNYFLDVWPKVGGITTHFITGCCHEGWWHKREGIDFGSHLVATAAQRGRRDLVHLGFGEADVRLPVDGGGEAIMRLCHPGGGTAYALSYKPQKIVESYQGGEKPAILLIGHFHKAEYIPTVRNVHTVQAGCCQDQTRFMRSRHIDAHVGFWVLRFAQDDLGAVRRFRAEWFGWYDRGYHISG